MALSQDTEFRIDHAVTDDKIGDEIAARIEVSSTPADDTEAQAILNLLNSSRNAAILERLFVALAGDNDGAAGKELAKKINGMVAVLQAKADGTEIAAVAATATLDLTTDIVLTSVAAGAARNTNTVTLEVEAAAANPTDTVLADVTGTAAAIIITITPNDGTNNGATPVDLTTAELAELINSGTVVGKAVTLTDAGGLIDDQTATGGDATALVDAGEGDGEVATFASGVNALDNDVVPAQTAMGSEHMGNSTFEALVHALASRPAAEEFRTAYNAMIDSVQAIAS
jgi:hypothetical protein